MSRRVRGLIVSLAIFQSAVIAANPASAADPVWETNGPPRLDNEHFQRVISKVVAPIARALPSFAGIYLDNTRDGRAVVMLTERDELAEDLMRALAPSDPGIERVLASHTYEELVTAADSALSLWPTITGHDAVGVSVSTQNNGLDVHVLWEDLPAASEAVDEAEGILGVRVHALGSDPLRELTCSDRDHCTNPMKAGNLIRKGNVNGSKCTMGFHVVRGGSNEQFLTAGHCGYPGLSQWYHQGYGYVGSSVANGLTISTSPKFDILRVEMPDSQASPVIFGDNVYLAFSGWEWPMVGSVVWVSAGSSDRVVHNAVIDDYFTYTNASCGCTAKGFKTSQTSGGAPGDSGSPTYVKDPPSLQAFAVGIGVEGQAGYDIAARVGDAVQQWDLTIVTN